MPGIIGQPRTLHTKHKFLVEIDGIGSAEFKSCSELAAEIAVIEYYAGGALTPDAIPGRIKVDYLTLERGATRDRDIFDWFQTVADMAKNSGLVDPSFKRNLEVVQLGLDGTSVRRWRVFEAWPIRFVAGSWDGDADEVTMETCKLRIKRFDLVKNI